MKRSSILDVKNTVAEEIARLTRSDISRSGDAYAYTAATNPKMVGLGRAKRNGENILAVRVFGKSSFWKNKLNWLKRITSGEVDVSFIGDISAVRPTDQIDPIRTRQRPLLIGSSISHGKVTAGTLGCFVQCSGRIAILTNNHVAANQNDASTGDKICQPGNADGGSIERDTVATLGNFVRINEKHNLVDAAYALLANGEAYDAKNIKGIGSLVGLYEDEIEPGDIVAKYGRTTGVTYGRVSAVEVDNVAVGYTGGAKSFDQQIEIEGRDNEGFSAGGDSGSMIVSYGRGNPRAVGLLFAGGPRGGRNGKGLTYANYMAKALTLLDCKLAY